MFSAPLFTFHQPLFLENPVAISQIFVDIRVEHPLKNRPVFARAVLTLEL